MKFTIPHNKGFTLVEALVAISILSLSIAATFTAVQSGIQNSTIAKDQTIAFNLSQEAIEFIKNIRDENGLHSVDGTTVNWLASISGSASDPCYFGKVCEIDSPLKTVTSCGSASITGSPPNLCPNIRQDPVTGLYGYNSGWAVTNFKREIQLQQISADEASVVISVSWTSRAGSRYFQAVETLFNHQ
ncbi:MAG TPA: type II secretion system protein [Candidatus Paceibacterota bacterium]